MKYLLSKSLQLIVVMITIGLLVTLCLSNLIEAFKMTNVPGNYVTNNYYEFSIGENRSKITQKNLNLSSMLEFLDNQESKFLLLKEADNNIFGVYAINHQFTPNIISGRSFSKEDFKNKTNTIIISNKLKNKCIKKDGDTYYKLDCNYFKVIGVFKQSDNPINPDADAYYNLASKNLISNDIIYNNYILGRFKIDAGNKTTGIVNKLNAYCTIKIMRTNLDNGFIERLKKAISSQGISLFPIILIIFLIVLNSVNISSNWIENRKQEIFIRRLVGADNKKIAIMLLKDLLLIVTFSYLIVLIFNIVLSNINLVIMSNFKFSIDTIIISYFVIMIIGMLTIGLMLVGYCRHNISKIRG